MPNEIPIISSPELEAPFPAFEAEIYKYIEQYVECADRPLLREKGNFFRSWRERYNLSEEEVAQNLGVSVPFVSLLEEGLVPESAMPGDFVYKYAESMGNMGLLHDYAGKFHAGRYVSRKLRAFVESQCALGPMQESS